MNRFPWWGSVLLAILAYCSLKYGVRELLPEEHRLLGLLQLLAPLAAMALLLLAGKQLYDHDDGESTTEIEDDSLENNGEKADE
ncbi:hypothetical protein [Desulfopila aestuarii]|uniref:Uncharacterized protein n=1 Tax=Desulfopila aestuarii DSM 18488 TaxID=1121416 RepID=A0A1M7YGI6_9BACT|nr:hypothetical protein [Desulfopila aestuarii]SHO51706.1 hypothetical protein SAMN02745220_04179 [Desulfopila aestuarii DSM 18488]